MTRLVGALLLAVLTVFAMPAASANVDDFTFDSFHADYTLTRDADGHSQLHVREELIAVFPSYDQNRGIRRDIPSRYQGIDTRIDIVSVTDGAGQRRDFTSAKRGDFLSLTIAVPEGSFVHGIQTYVIEYTQRDVTDYFANTGRDEFYWDVNGTGWAQPFGQVSAALWLDSDLASALTGDAACYYGADGANTQCDVRRSDLGGETMIAASVRDLDPYENMTIAVGFQAGTFAEAELPWIEQNADFVGGIPLIGGGLAVLLSVLAGLTSWRNAPREKPVTASPIPPEGIDMFLAANLMGLTGAGVPAMLLDFAVRGNATVLEYVPPVDPDARPPRRAERTRAATKGHVYGVRAESTVGLSETELRFGKIVFPPKMEEGETRWFENKPDRSLVQRVSNLTMKTHERSVTEGYRRKPAKTMVWVLLGVLLLIIVATLVASALIGNRSDALPPFAAGMIAGVVTLMCIAMGLFRRPLTRKGREAKDQLLAVRAYLRLPDAQRALLDQQASRAPRELLYAAPYYSATPGPIAFSVETLRLHERLLPYAVLMGREKQWLEVLELENEGRSPQWYESNSSTPSYSFAIAVSSFTGQASTTMTPASSGGSSSSGGSGGGGSSGGGGGGGGGGGV